MTPKFRILAEGHDITAFIGDRRLDLRVTDEAGFSSDSVELTIDNRDNKVALPRTGAELEIFIGYEESGLSRMGLYTVDEISLSGPPDKLTLTGKAANMCASLKARKTRSWDQVTIGNLVGQIAPEHGYVAKVSPTLASVTLAHVDQTEESDLHLLTRLAKEHDAVAKPAGGNYLFVPKGEAKTATGKNMPAVSLVKTDMHRWNVTIADRGKYQSVTAYWHDTASAKRQAVSVGSGDPVCTLPGTYPDADAARKAAQGKKDALERGVSKLELTTDGNPYLAAEAKLNISGVMQGVNGEWVITRAVHTLDANGYRCTISADTPKAR